MRYALYGFIGLMLLITIPLIFRIISFTPNKTPYDTYIQDFFDHEAVLNFDKQFAMFSEEKQKKLGSLTTFSKSQMEMIRRTRQETKGRKAVLQKIEVGRELPDDVELTAFIDRGPRKETYLFALQKQMEGWRVYKYEELRVVDFSSVVHQTPTALDVQPEISPDAKSADYKANQGPAVAEESSQAEASRKTKSVPKTSSSSNFEDRSAGFQNFSKEKVTAGNESRNEPMAKAENAKQTLEGLLSDAESMGVISKDEYEKRAQDLKGLSAKK